MILVVFLEINIVAVSLMIMLSQKQIPNWGVYWTFEYQSVQGSYNKYSVSLLINYKFYFILISI